jgi:hypothetical protein
MASTAAAPSSRDLGAFRAIRICNPDLESFDCFCHAGTEFHPVL